jgi:predicted membrane-bound dolichyl-phosphate-mannose-protein mannosyltransferase
MSTQVSADLESCTTSLYKVSSFLNRRWVTIGGVVLLLLVLLGQLAWEEKNESLSWDEGDHIFSGYMSLKHRDFGLNPEHPPLVKMVAALPLLSMHLREPQLQNRYFKTEAYLSGRDLIFGNDFEKVIFRARMAASVFMLLLALLVFLTAREMFGTGAGFLALVLVVFEPNLLAHGAKVTTDIGAACFLLATIYAFYRYVKIPTWGRLLLMGLAAGLFCISKHSAVLLAIMLPALALTELFRRRRTETGRSIPEIRLRQGLRLAGAILFAAVMSIGIIWTCYGFRYQMRPAGLRTNPPLAATLHNLKPSEAKVIRMMARLHVLPESYIYGLADVRSVANTWPSYVFGRVYAHGVWFYFPVCFLLKTTIPTLLLLLLVVFAVATGKLRAWREMLFLTIPPAIYFGISLTSQLNIGVRHILLVFVFCLLLCAGAAWSLIQKDRRWIWPIAALLLFHMISSLRCMPTSYIAYSNELWGGPSSTYKYVTDSNTDWAQQLKAVKRYVDQRGIRQCWFAYFVQPAVPFEAYGIPCQPLPTPDTSWFGLRTYTPPVIQGPVFMSQSDLTGYEYGSNVLNPYRSFQKLQPTAIIEHGVWVFDGTFSMAHASAIDRIARARELMDTNLPEQALAEARSAVALAPDAIQALMGLGEIQKSLHQDSEARANFEKALAIAHTMEPTAQEEWIPRIERMLREKK